VVVTGASGRIGRVLVPPLVERGEVRAVVRAREDAEDLRASGAKVAVTELSDTSVMHAVLRGAHTVIHLAGGLDLPDDEAYEAANIGTTRDVLEVAAEVRVARFLFLSYPGASPGSSNAYLRAKGRAEEAVRASGLDHLILRSTFVYGPGQWWQEEMRRAGMRLVAQVSGNGRQRLAPLFVSDLVNVLLAADERTEPVSGSFGIQGPDVVTADQAVDLVAGRSRPKLHAKRVHRRRLHPAVLELLASDSLSDAPPADRELGVALTPLREGLLRSA
jgi:NADH dehydrogenase